MTYDAHKTEDGKIVIESRVAIDPKCVRVMHYDGDEEHFALEMFDGSVVRVNMLRETLAKLLGWWK